MIKDIIDKIESFCNQVINSSESGYLMKLNAAQTIYLKANDFSGICKRIHMKLDHELLNKSFHCLIREQEFLRSRLVDQDGSYYWQISEYHEHFEVPIVDISMHSEQVRNEIVNQCISQIYLKPYELMGSVLYRICVLKEDESKFILFFPASHIIFDAMSADIVLNHLFEFYQQLAQSREIEPNVTNEFRNYLAQMKKGPKYADENELMSEFAIKDFYDAISRTEQEINQKNIKILSSLQNVYDINEIDPLAEAIGLVTGICTRALDVSQIPLWMVNLGRAYENNIYLDIVGLFVDFIPVVCSADESRASLDITRKLNIKRLNNVNFMSFLSSDWIPTGYQTVSDLLCECFGRTKIMFNYVGEIPNDIELDQDIYRSSANKSQKTVLFTVFIKDNQIHIKCDISEDLKTN